MLVCAAGPSHMNAGRQIDVDASRRGLSVSATQGDDNRTKSVLWVSPSCVCDAGRQQQGRRQAAVRGGSKVAQQETHHGASGRVSPHPSVCLSVCLSAWVAIPNHIGGVHSAPDGRLGSHLPGGRVWALCLVWDERSIDTADLGSPLRSEVSIFSFGLAEKRLFWMRGARKESLFPFPPTRYACCARSCTKTSSFWT
jgi:hypothetical protein